MSSSEKEKKAKKKKKDKKERSSFKENATSDEDRVPLTQSEVMSAFGFGDDHCHTCGILNTEISGYLMQCGKCKKAYYCSMKCFNEDLPAHTQWCNTAQLGRDPTRTGDFDFNFKRPPRIAAVDMGDGLYRIRAIHHESIKAVAVENGFEYDIDLDHAVLVHYGLADKQTCKKGAFKGNKTVRQLLGHGTIHLIADNGRGKTDTAEIEPAEPDPPKIQAQELRPGIYKVFASDGTGGALKIQARDGQGHEFANVRPGATLQYDKAGDGEASRETVGPAPLVGNIPKLAGHGDLTLTVINDAGKTASVSVKPRDPPPPKIKIDVLGDNLYKLKIKDPAADDGPLDISVVDGEGNPLQLSNKDVFSYTAGPPGQETATDDDDNTVQKLSGPGNLAITATNCYGKTATKQIEGTLPPPPTMSVETLENLHYRIQAIDPSGAPLTFRTVDEQGHVFAEPGIDNSTIFSYVKAPDGRDGQQVAGTDPAHGDTIVQKLRGHGELTITATNPAGQSCSAIIDPDEPLAPILVAEPIKQDKSDKNKTKLYRLKAADPFGDPVTITATDTKDDYQFNNDKSFLQDGTVFSYTDMGKGQQHGQNQVQQVDDDGNNTTIQQLTGLGPLQLTATNPAGKTSRAFVKPSKAPPPTISIEPVAAEKDGTYQIVASDPSGGPISITAADGRGFAPTGLDNGTVFSYHDAGEAAPSQTTSSTRDNGNTPNQDKQLLQGHGPLTVTVTNGAGQTAQASVLPTAMPPPVVNVVPVPNNKSKNNIEWYRLEATDPLGAPLTVTAVDQKTGHAFDGRLADQTVFSYQESQTNSAGGDNAATTLHGLGDLTITATNPAGLTARATVHPQKMPPPQITVKAVPHQTGVYRIEAQDPLLSDDEKLAITVTDPAGEPYPLVDEAPTFRYLKGDRRATTTDDDLPDWRGHGPLTVTATNPVTGQSAQATVQPVPVPPPVIKVKKVKKKEKENQKPVYQLVVTDPLTAGPVTVAAQDANGHVYKSDETPGHKSLFSYQDAGPRPSGRAGPNSDNDDTTQLLGQGDLTLTATNAEGQQATVVVQPTAAPPPNLQVEDLGQGWKRVHATDPDTGLTLPLEMTDHRGVPLEFANIKKGKKGNNEPAVFRYFRTPDTTTTTTTELDDPTHGPALQIYGTGDLTVKATSPAGPTATTTVSPQESGDPILKLREVSGEPGVYTVQAIDPNGDAVTVQAEDADGNVVLQLPTPKSKFRFSDEPDEPNHALENPDAGIFDFQMPELWITCYNKAGKKKRTKVPKAAPRKPRDPVPPLTIPEFDAGEPVRVKRPSPKKRVLTKEIRDKLIFWYGRLGHPTRDVMKKKVAGLPESCGITPEDVELLPWIINGRMLRTRDLHKEVMVDSTVWHEHEED